MKFYLALFILISVFSCSLKEDEKEKLEEFIENYQSKIIPADSSIHFIEAAELITNEMDTFDAYNPYRIVKGDKLVFEYFYQNENDENITDNGYEERITFQVLIKIITLL